MLGGDNHVTACSQRHFLGCTRLGYPPILAINPSTNSAQISVLFDLSRTLRSCPQRRKALENCPSVVWVRATLFEEKSGSGVASGRATKYVKIKSTTVYAHSSKLGLSQPLSCQRVCPSPQNRGVGWGAHSPAGEGLGESQFRRLEKRLALCLLCEQGSRSYKNFHASLTIQDTQP